MCYTLQHNIISHRSLSKFKSATNFTGHQISNFLLLPGNESDTPGFASDTSKGYRHPRFGNPDLVDFWLSCFLCHRLSQDILLVTLAKQHKPCNFTLIAGCFRHLVINVSNIVRGPWLCDMQGGPKNGTLCFLRLKSSNVDDFETYSLSESGEHL